MIKEITIKAYERTYEKEVKVLLKSLWGNSKDFFKYGENTQTYLTLKGNKVIGFYSTWYNSFHPNALYFTINISPKYQKKGIGSRLFEEVLKNNEKKLTLQTSLWESKFSGNKFLKKQGFIEMRKTYEVELLLSNIEIDDYEDFLIILKDTNYSIKSIEELKDEQLREIAALCKEAYSFTHEENPPKDLSVENWQGLIMDGLLKEGSYVVMKNNVIIGFSLLHYIDERAAEVGWKGVGRKYSKDEDHIILSLAYNHIKYLKTEGYEKFTTEIDSTDKWATLLLNYLPFEAAPTWITYQRKNP